MRLFKQLIAAVLLCASPLFAQDEIPTRVTNQNRMGPLPYSTSVGSDIEHVDLATGALSVHIPIWSVPGRGMDASLSFHWNSNYLMAAGRTDSLGQLTYLYTIARDSGWQSNHPYFTAASTAGQCSEGVLNGQPPRNVLLGNQPHLL